MINLLFLTLAFLLVCVDVRRSAYAQSGFSIYKADLLDDTLGEECINALSANINCVQYVQTFTHLTYRGSLESVKDTDALCSSDCSSSLANWFTSVSTKCAGKTVNEAIPTKFGGYMWAGFNETCVKDPKSKQYCNDIISNFTDVSDITKMPRTELCHTCHIRRLALMQSSQYSIYDSFYKEQLEYVYKQCGGNGPTAIPEPLTPVPVDPAPYCVTGKRYTTKKGDTCESIANSTSVSSAALYMGNQDILRDCLDVEPGLSLCVPMTCQTYYVKPKDTCVSIEMSLDLDFGQIESYNSWLNRGCLNLQSGTSFYGKMICVSPQGGTFTGTIAPPAPTTNPGLGDGYSRTAVPPPVGVSVAEGTTRNCGKWHVVSSGDTCSTICIRNMITTDLFHLVNPSLKSVGCDASLKLQSALCVGPTYMWNTTIPVTSIASSSPIALPSSGSTGIRASSTSIKVSSTSARSGSITKITASSTAVKASSSGPKTSSTSAKATR